MQAILITAYKNYSHLKEIINFFNNEYSIYIHIDKKSVFSNEQMENLKTNNTVKYVTKKYNVNWGGINHLLAIIDLMQEAKSNIENDYFHLITGHDYPIKNLEYLREFYLQNKDFSFMEYHPLPYSPWESGGLDRLQKYNMYDLINGKKGNGENINKRILKIQNLLHIKRGFYKNFPKLYGGSTYWSISREAIDYIFNYVSANPKYLKRFKYSFCSEEIFFQTILLNSDLKNKIVNNNKRFIVWVKRNGNFPANLDSSDISSIISSDALFARKFETPTSGSLLKKLKTHLTHSEM